MYTRKCEPSVKELGAKVYFPDMYTYGALVVLLWGTQCLVYYSFRLRMVSVLNGMVSLFGHSVPGLLAYAHGQSVYY